MSGILRPEEQLADELTRLRRRVAELEALEARRKQTEEALAEKFRLYFEHIADIICVLDTDLTILSVSPSVERILGYVPAELVGRRLAADLLPPDSLERAIADVARALSSEGQLDYGEYAVLAKDGMTHLLEVSGAPLRSQGEVVGIVCVARDVTERRRIEEALRQSEERLRLTIEATRDGIWQNTPGHKDDFFSDTMFTMLGYEPVDPMQAFHFFRERLHPEDVPRFEEAFRATQKPGHDDYVVEFRLRAQDGSWRHILSRGRCIERDSQGKVLRIVGTHTDITERVRAEEALRQSEAMFRHLVETIPAAVFIYQGNRIRYANPGAEKLTGYTQQEFRSMNFWDLAHPDFRKPVRERGLARQKGEPVPSHYEFKIVTKGGEERWIDFSGCGIEFEGASAGLGIAYDVTDHKRADIENARLMGELTRHERALRKLSARVLEAQEEERGRISRELHDEMGQALTAISINLASIQNHLPSEALAVVGAQLAEARALADQILKQMRELAQELHPTILDELGLVPAVRAYLNRWAQRMGVEVQFEVIGIRERMEPEVATTLYRIIQEALTNVARHAQASQVKVRMQRNASSLTVVIEDDGKGFAMAKFLGAPDHGIGLLGIQERLSALGGSLDIYSRPGSGTRLSVKIPLQEGGAGRASQPIPSCQSSTL